MSKEAGEREKREKKVEGMSLSRAHPQAAYRGFHCTHQ